MCTEGPPARPPALTGPPPRARRRERGDDPLWIVGLVGRAGSGKSTVAHAFAERGFPVLEADVIGHEVTEGDHEVHSALVAEYGTDVYRADGTLDRARVAAKVFRDASALARLNALVHPRIVAALLGGLSKLRVGGYRGVVMIEAALILNWGFERDCDFVLAVTAPDADLIERLARTRGWSEEDARARLNAQPTSETMAAAADVVIENRGSEAELVEAALREIAAHSPVARRGAES